MGKILTCISCPLGCQINVTKTDDEFSFNGYTCQRGLKYASEEMKNPKRMLTSTVKVSNGKESVVSIKTTEAIPKEKIFDAMNEINKLTVSAPIKIGDILIKNIAKSNADIIATKNVNTL